MLFTILTTNWRHKKKTPKRIFFVIMQNLIVFYYLRYRWMFIFA